MRQESMDKKERVKKKVFEKRKKFAKCYGCGSQVYRFTEKYEYLAK